MNKKSYIIFTLSLSILILTVLLGSILTSPVIATSSLSQLNKPTIILDPGHGGEDGGAVADSGVLEKDINLAISNKLRTFFQINGFDVEMTRDDDTALYDNDRTNTKKRSDLENRVKMFNSSANNIVISIHQNKFTQSQYSGAQVFYSANNDLSADLAEDIRFSINSLIQKDNNRQCKQAGSEIFILDNTAVPAVMVECGFLSNIQETEKLQDDKYQSELAYSIFLGFLEFYYKNYK
ncbi:MAG: N-acetylmuramoyl-L-alanine amidase [Eubacteriales bacterium]|nr:N-acetylmuramoyl-L-alanine amidase [Eubacteriales bacterium]